MSLFNPTAAAIDADRRILRALRAEVENLTRWQQQVEDSLAELTASTRRIAGVLDELLGHHPQDGEPK